MSCATAVDDVIRSSEEERKRRRRKERISFICFVIPGRDLRRVTLSHSHHAMCVTYAIAIYERQHQRAVKFDSIVEAEPMLAARERCPCDNLTQHIHERNRHVALI